MRRESNKSQEFTTRDFTNLIKKYTEQYAKASRKEKQKLLEHLATVTLRRKDSIARTLRQAAKPKSYSTDSNHPPQHIAGARGRPIIYTPEVDHALEYIWEAYDHPCADRLHPEIAEAIMIFKRDHEWTFSEQATNLLLRMPLNTMRPRLVELAHRHDLARGFSTTQASLIKDLVPTFHGDWSTMPLGYGQIDTVVHAGGELIGDMVYTVNFIEMQTYWQEPVAQLTKSDDVTLASIKLVEERLPFPLVGAHPDSGSEFLNWLLLDWCRNKALHNDQKVDLTRSRANKKNDNANVEERNNHVIRKYLGYERYDCIEAVNVMNELYETLRLYINHFQPVQKLDGYKLNASGKKRRRYDTAKTPYQRVLEHPEASDETKTRLIAEHQSLNPKHLLAKIKALTVKLREVQRKYGYKLHA